ncbi:MAG: enoyl-CoA hydratase/isomerase family protein [Actinobacteria bacterium]|nr:enoyl-CoA hydratase/isomerase family protein [Actinomycetota bacterium]
MTVLRSPSELLAFIAGGLDDTALGVVVGSPAVVVDLSEPFETQDLLRISSLLSTMPVVLIGISDGGPIDGSAIVGLDVALCSGDDASAPWVSCGNSLDKTLSELISAIEASPDASVALGQLLRVGERSSASEAVIAESWVYSLLQGGDTHSRWLDARSTRTARPRPDSSVVLVERNDNVLSITLDRPEVHNAYGTRMRDELVEAFRLVGADPTIVNVVLRGTGPSFCSGGDLDEFGTAPAPVMAHSIRTSRNAGIALAAIADRVEVVIHGSCVGAGVELPAFAARVIAHSETSFLLPEIAMGLVPGAGGTSSIPRRIGRHRTAYFGLSGRPISADTAMSWGLIDAIDNSRFEVAEVAR